MMTKAGIDTEGPKNFLQIGEKFSSSSVSLLDNEVDKDTETIEAFLSKEAKAEEEAEKPQDLSEKDDLVDDDAVEVKNPKPAAKVNNLKKNNNLKDKKVPIVFTEVTSKSLSAAEKNKIESEIESEKVPTKDNKMDPRFLYSKPTDKFEPQMMEKIKILRENSMRSLQKSHVWHHAKSELQKEAFNKKKYQQGNKDADLFVSFLGYIRDTTYKQSPALFDKIKKKFSK